MEFLTMNTLTQEPQMVINQLQYNDELVIIRNGKPVMLILDLAGLDLVDTLSIFRKIKVALTKNQDKDRLINKDLNDMLVKADQGLSPERKTAAIKFLDNIRELSKTHLTPKMLEDFAALESGAYRPDFSRELDL